MWEVKIGGPWSEASPRKNTRINKAKRAGGVGQVIKCLLSKPEALSSNPRPSWTGWHLSKAQEEKNAPLWKKIPERGKSQCKGRGRGTCLA
jgi:hypothetical protein